jgi:hypothetical protein
MEIFINEMSLQGQYPAETNFAQAVRQLIRIFAAVHEKKLTSYKNHDILLNRKAIQDDYFTSSFEQIRDKSLKVAFREIIFNKNNPKDWTTQQKHQSKDVFYCEILDDFVNDTTLAEVAERVFLQEDEKRRVLVHFKASSFQKTPISIFRNDDDLKNPILLDGVETKEDFEKWFNLSPVDPEKWLKTELLFQKTTFQVQGKPIYKHLQTGQYWYIDNFHKQQQGNRHFEVFDASGKNHLGEADLNGNLDITKADNRKKLYL